MFLISYGYFFDGGICRGTDVVKALSLGADSVGIGRLQCYAAATNGRKGLNNDLKKNQKFFLMVVFVEEQMLLKHFLLVLIVLE